MGLNVAQNTAPDHGHDAGKPNHRANHAACRHAFVVEQQMGKDHGQDRHGAKDDARQAGIDMDLTP